MNSTPPALSHTRSFGFEFAQVLAELALAYPEAKTIHLVMDNLNIHHKKPLTDLYGPSSAAR